MTFVLVAATLALSLFASPSARAQGQESTPARGSQPQNNDSQGIQGHIIRVIRSGEAYAKPDLGILVMSIQSLSPASDSLPVATRSRR
jgi:hypothetical protein